jgi:mutator protein MutT
MSLIKIIHALIRLKWRIMKPVTIGARVMIIKNDSVLLVKHTYQNHYFLPGGMVKRGETFEQAARRELKEEVGIDLKEIKLFGVYNNFYESKNDSIVVFLCLEYQLKDNKNKDIEIETFNFFKLNELPKDISPGTRRRIEEYSEGKFVYYGLW